MMLLAMACGWVGLYLMWSLFLMIHPVLEGVAGCACLLIAFHSWHCIQVSQLWRQLCKNNEDTDGPSLPGTPPYGPAFQGKRLRGLSAVTCQHDDWADVQISQALDRLTRRVPRLIL